MIGLAGWNGAIRMMEEKGRMGKNRDDGEEWRGWCLIEFVILAHQNRPLADSRKSPFLRGI
jgi:hypothetical protein